MAKNQRNIFIGLGLVVAVAAIFSVLASGGSETSTTTIAPSADGSVTAAEYQPITVTGEGLTPLGDSGTDASVGAPGPALKGYTHAGAPIEVVPSESGTPTMLVFLAHWCPHCNREIPRLNDWKERGLVPDNLRVIGITTASRNDQANWPPSEWMNTMEWTFEVMADSDTQQAATAYGVDGFPFMVILDAQGNVAKRFSGEVEVADLVSIIDTAIGRT